MRRYKFAVIMGILDDSGIAEEIVFGTLKTHDTWSSAGNCCATTSCFYENDVLINDRGSCHGK